jgi:hypothetical protein
MMSMDTGPMRVLMQLQAEIERNRAAIAALQDAYSGLRRIVGVFYDAGREDALKGKHRKDRHLKLLSAVIIAGMAGTPVLRPYAAAWEPTPAKAAVAKLTASRLRRAPQGVMHAAGVTCHGMVTEVTAVTGVTPAA